MQDDSVKIKDLKPGEVLLRDAGSQCWLFFSDPQTVLVAHDVSAVCDLLREVEERVERDGLYAAGFISYEAAPAFDDHLVVQRGDRPLVQFGLYQEPRVVELPVSGDAGGADWQPGLFPEVYGQALKRVHQYLEAGDSYQVNYTMRMHAGKAPDPVSFFCRRAEAAPYAAMMRTDDTTICSLSPELFFERHGEKIITRPMKGTASRAPEGQADLKRAEELAACEKNRAENLMIVDMLRNDLGRIAEPGSVDVPSLFDIERYPTVWQMTSTVTARSNVSQLDLLKALFPCASITGAPKRRTMEIIAELEVRPRGIYTGSIGYFAPGRRAQFNVAIRTAVFSEGRATYGVGGGIVWDSYPEDEYDECLHKAKVLQEARAPFQLLETMCWSPEAGIVLRSEHVARVLASAEYFGVPLRGADLEQALDDAVSGLGPAEHKIRMLVDCNGGVDLESSVLGQLPQGDARLAIADEPVDRNDPFLYHKTTRRAVYEAAKAAYPEADDVLLWNSDGQITETCIANVIVLIGGVKFTPPVSCGLLSGTQRAAMLESGEIRERVITLDELQHADSITLINSVRPPRRAILI